MWYVFYNIDDDNLESIIDGLINHTGNPYIDFKDTDYLGPFLTELEANEAENIKCDAEYIGIHMVINLAEYQNSDSENSFSEYHGI